MHHPVPSAGEQKVRTSGVLSRRRGALGAAAAALAAGLVTLTVSGPAGAAPRAPAEPKEFHGYSVAYQEGDHLTGVRGRFRDFAPNYALDPTDHSDDVNGVVWIILGSGTSLEIGYTVLAVGAPGSFEAYRYIEINRADGQQQIIAMDRLGLVTAEHAEVSGIYDTFPADTASHDYAIVREKLNPRAWDFYLDNRIVYRYTTGKGEFGKLLESGIESYHPLADVLDTFSGLGKQRNGRWSPWTHQDVRVGRPHLSGFWTGRTAWTATQHA